MNHAGAAGRSERVPSELITVLIFKDDRRSARDNVVLVLLPVFAMLDYDNYGRFLVRIKWFIPVRRVVA